MAYYVSFEQTEFFTQIASQQFTIGYWILDIGNTVLNLSRNIMLGHANCMYPEYTMHVYAEPFFVYQLINILII